MRGCQHHALRRRFQSDLFRPERRRHADHPAWPTCRHQRQPASARNAGAMGCDSDISAHQADKEHDRLTAIAPIPISPLLPCRRRGRTGRSPRQRNLDQPLPASLVGRAGYNLELLPSIYMDKRTRSIQGLRRVAALPRSQMTIVLRTRRPKRLWYVEQWHKAKGYTEPLPFASGRA